MILSTPLDLQGNYAIEMQMGISRLWFINAARAPAAEVAWLWHVSFTNGQQCGILYKIFKRN